MQHGTRAGVLALVLGWAGVAACAPPSPSSVATVTASTVAAATGAAATAAPPGAVPIDVRFAGGTNCSSFPYTCFAVLSVLEPNAAVPDSWRPAASDPRWFADDGKGATADRFDPKPLGSAAAAPGSHRLVMTLLGSYDTPSLGPDGKEVFSMDGRCTADVDVPGGAAGVDVLVTFTPDPATFGGSCTMTATPR